MSDLLESRLTPEQLQECAKNDALMGIKTAHGIKTSTEMFRAGGNHLSAGNDEPSLELLRGRTRRRGSGTPAAPRPAIPPDARPRSRSRVGLLPQDGNAVMTSPTQSAMEQQQRDELLPCPFCGHVGLVFSEGSTFRWRLAECGGCGASTGEERIQTMGDGTSEEWEHNCRQRILNTWNRRAESSELRSLRDSLALARSHIGELREALEGMLTEAHNATKPLHESSEWSIKARAALNKEQP